jgi:hypothetical protein
VGAFDLSSSTSILGGVKDPWAGTIGGSIQGTVKPTATKTPTKSSGSGVGSALQSGLSTLTSYFGAKQAEAQAAAAMAQQPQSTNYMPWLLIGGVAIAAVVILKRRK